MARNKDLLTYGKVLSSGKIKELLLHVFNRNNEMIKEGKKATPVMIWGTHGIGKTQMVEELAKENGWKFAHFAPAQFEEMGDLLGMPIQSGDNNAITKYCPPEWVPTESGPGILLIDDMNRADDRILRGMMQLLQNYELVSWKLPEKWQIVATANPEGGDYSVTPMDDAILTRLLHVTMEFEPKVWAEWATNAGVDQRGIEFILTYPEIVQGGRTTPRSLTQFFEQIHGIDDLNKNIEMVDTLARSSLEDETTLAFLSFVKDDLKYMITPSEILGKSTEEIDKLFKMAVIDKNGKKRVDRIATICHRLYIHITRKGFKVTEPKSKALVEFLLRKEIPADLRLGFYKDLGKHSDKDLIKMLQDPRFAKAVAASI